MSINISFIGEDRSERVGFIADSLKFNTDIGRTVILLADEYTFGLANGYVLSPGYGNDRPVDFALEALHSAGSVEKGAETLSRILVSDEVIRNVRDAFWERSARRIIRSLALAAARAEAFMRKNTPPPHMSLTARMDRIFSEAADKKLSKSKERLWWEKYDDGMIRTLILDNAPNTAAGMISVTRSYLDPLCRISAHERTDPIETDRPVIVYRPAYGEDELRILLSLLELRMKGAVLLAPEAHEYGHLLESTGFDAICSTLRPMEGKTIIFGRQGITPFFKSKVYDTTGFERLTFLEYETPDMLPPGKALAVTGTKWDVADVSFLLPPEKGPDLKVEGSDEVIKDLLSKEAPCEDLVSEKDVQELGLELITDDCVILEDLADLEDFLNDDEDQ